MLTLSDPEFHTRIMHKHRSGKRKYIVFPALVYNQIPRWIITFHNKLHVAVQLQQMFQGFADKPVPEASAFKDKKDYVKRTLVSFPKDIFQWIPVATKETRTIFVSNNMSPSKKAIHSPLAVPGRLNSVSFLRKVTNRDILNEGALYKAEHIKNYSVHDANKLRSYFESGHKMSLPSYMPNTDLTEIVRSGWKKNYHISSISLADVNRNFPVHPAHKYGFGLPDSKNILRINGAQNSAVGNGAIDSRNIEVSDVSGAGKELVFHTLPDIGRSGWKKTLFVPSICLVDVNRNIQVHPVHEHELRVPDSMNVLRINEAQSPGVSNEDIGSLNIKARNISQVDTELVFHALPDIDHLINQKLMEIKSSIALTKETMMVQSATTYSKIETDLKRQFNIDQISEKVYRQIDHRLKIECERRGIQ